MLRTKISMLLLAAMVLCIGASVAQAQDPAADSFQVNYFAGARGARPDQTVRITNPGTNTEDANGFPTTDNAGPETADICANIYVFSPDQQLAECCSCFVSPNGLRTLSVNFDLASNPLTPTVLGEGVIKIVSSYEGFAAVDAKGACHGLPTGPANASTADPSTAATSYIPVAALRAWATHNQDISGALSPTFPATFSSRSSFNAASTGNTTITFNGIAAPGSFVFFGNNGTTTQSGVTFTASGGNAFFVVDQGFNPGFYTTGSASAGGVLSTQNGNSTPAILTIALPIPVTAVGFDTNTVPGAVVTLNLSDGEVLSYTTAGSTGRFFGFTTGVGITSLTLTKPSGGTSDILNIDDFTFGRAVGATNQVTETHFLDAKLSQAELTNLQTNCDFIQRQGSGAGKCSCGRGD